MRGQQTWAFDAIYVKHFVGTSFGFPGIFDAIPGVAAMTTMLSHVQKIHQQLDGMVVSLTISVTFWLLKHPSLLENSR